MRFTALQCFIIMFSIPLIFIIPYATYRYKDTHRDRWYLDKYARQVGIEPRLFESDSHLRKRIQNKTMLIKNGRLTPAWYEYTNK